MTQQDRIRRAFLTTSITALAALGACGKTPESQPPAPLTPPISMGTQVDDIAVTLGVKSALFSDALVKGFDIQVKTRKGMVQLSGYVDSQAQIDQALRLTRAVTGVAEVTNGITLMNGASSLSTQLEDSAITGRVKAALLADPSSMGFDIGVLTFKGEVQLSGFVNSQAQVDRATLIARATDGASGVKNELSIKE